MSDKNSSEKVIEILCEGQSLTAEDLAAIAEDARYSPPNMRVSSYYDYFENHFDKTDWKKFFAGVEWILTQSKDEQQELAVCYYVLESLPHPSSKKPFNFEYFKPFMGPASLDYYLGYNETMDQIPDKLNDLKSKK